MAHAARHDVASSRPDSAHRRQDCAASIEIDD
jgi:hypothetical protein